MPRTLIEQIPANENKVILIKGRVFNIRNLSNVVFVLVQDYTGTIQCVSDKPVEVKIGEFAEIEGTVKKEPRSKFGFEVQCKKVTAVSKLIEELPFDLAKNELNLSLATLLDQRPLALRHQKIQAIFRLYDILLKSYGVALREEKFIEIKTPKLLGAPTEGGAEFFSVDYFDREATLAQSPQFYKQIMVGAFERVFEIGSAFRAELHFTSRHVNEYTSLDAEMGFIESFEDVGKMLNNVLRKMFAILGEEGKPYLDAYNVEIPEVPAEIPYLKLAEAKNIIKKEYKYTVPEDTDIDSKGEELIGRYAKEKLNSDFVFVSHYPWFFRPFYTMPDPENPRETLGFDLLFRGLEIATGSQRIHSYQQLIENMKKKEVKPKGLEFYLNIFKYSMPPHGGWGMGSERIIQQILGLKNIKEAVLFPRDVKRLIP
jgi:nondiscriminating aspartyl-tRNA synthetase